MARRILSADTVLVPQTQASLNDSVRTEPAGSVAGRLAAIQARWVEPPPAGPREALFDWADREELSEEEDEIPLLLERDHSPDLLSDAADQGRHLLKAPLSRVKDPLERLRLKRHKFHLDPVRG